MPRNYNDSEKSKIFYYIVQSKPTEPSDIHLQEFKICYFGNIRLLDVTINFHVGIDERTYKSPRKYNSNRFL